ncbi:MAG: amidohydrolase [Ferruginibacter sp.]
MRRGHCSRAFPSIHYTPGTLRRGGAWGAIFTMIALNLLYKHYDQHKLHHNEMWLMNDCPNYKIKKIIMDKTTSKMKLLFTAILFSTATLHAQTTQKVKQLAYADSSRLVEIFKDIHQNPELGFMETRTSGIIATALKALGYETITGIGKTGVVGILKNGNGPIVMYRADMDCNPVKETTGLPYASNKTMKKEDGAEVPVMHACGHDAHVTWLLGIAKIMVTLKDEWKGTLVIVGQPAEEPLQGAQAMIDDKMYDKGVPVPDYLFGMHTWPIPVGYIYNVVGERMAGSDQLDITFYGIGGHGAHPETTKDPIVMGSTAVMQYQSIISRNIAAQDAAVLTVGAFLAGFVNNVIPPTALLKLNLRWFNDKDRNILMDGIKRINEGIAIANNLPKELYPTIKMKGMVYPLVNNAAMVNKINASLATVIAPGKIIKDVPAEMGSEDFPQLVSGIKKASYDFVMIGTANIEVAAIASAEGKKYPFFNHNGNYQVDLSAIPLGTQIGATALLEMFKK